MLKTLLLGLLTNLLRFIGGELLKLLNNKRVQKLAIQAVESAIDLDLDNDGKRDHARAVLVAGARVLSIELRDNYVNALIELALSKVKERSQK